MENLAAAPTVDMDGTVYVGPLQIEIMNIIVLDWKLLFKMSQ